LIETNALLLSHATMIGSGFSYHQKFTK